mgnify:CR=1 FL=1
MLQRPLRTTLGGSLSRSAGRASATASSSLVIARRSLWISAFRTRSCLASTTTRQVLSLQIDSVAKLGRGVFKHNQVDAERGQLRNLREDAPVIGPSDTLHCQVDVAQGRETVAARERPEEHHPGSTSFHQAQSDPSGIRPGCPLRPLAFFGPQPRSSPYACYIWRNVYSGARFSRRIGASLNAHRLVPPRLRAHPCNLILPDEHQAVNAAWRLSLADCRDPRPERPRTPRRHTHTA